MKIIKLLAFFVFVMIAALQFSCGSDDNSNVDGDTSDGDVIDGDTDGDVDDNPYAGMGPYVALVSLENGSFIGLMESLEKRNYTNSDAYEVGGSLWFIIRDGIVWVYPKWGTGENEVKRFEIKNNKLFPLDSFFFPAGAGPTRILFVDDTTAYVSLSQIGQVAKFNPQTLEIGKTYYLSEYAFDDDDPETPEDKNPDPTSLLIRDGKLFVALSQNSTQMTSHPGLSVAIIDLETEKVEKVIEDKDTDFSWTGLQGIEDSMFMDENGDIYIHVVGNWGFTASSMGGFVRIKAGETEFDADYALRLEDLKIDGGDGYADYIYRPYYGGNGIVYASVNVPSLASNPPDYVNDKPIVMVAIDVWSKTVETLPFPASNAYAATIIADNGFALAGLSTNDGNGLYTYDIENKKVSEEPAVWTQGWLTCFQKVD